MAFKLNPGKRSIEKSLCKYGALCYQKNPEHHKKFKHPIKEDNETIPDENGNSFNDVPRDCTPEKSILPDEGIKKDSSSAQQNIVHSNDFKFEETVNEILKSMPEDFLDFWSFCCSIKKSNPEDAFLEFGYKLVGAYDLLAQKLPADKKVDVSCHWRYFYDPPEFQTVIKKNSKDLYHIGYFRDDPSQKPSILASNSAAIDEKLNLMGDNIFCAMNVELTKIINAQKSKSSNSKTLKKVQEDLLKFASEKKYSVQVHSAKSKQRQKNIVAKTFHGLGIVVPVKNDVGYRPLPDSNSTLKKILKNIVTAKTEAERLEQEESLDEIITNVHFANDECDYGMGLELGIDLFCFGDPLLHDHILSVLPLAYTLLKRPKYASIVKAHLKNRQKSSELSTLK